MRIRLPFKWRISIFVWRSVHRTFTEELKRKS